MGFFLLILCLLSFSNAEILLSINSANNSPLIIPNIWRSYIVYFYPIWGGDAPSTEYPFIENIEFFTATGGCYLGFPHCLVTLDLFTDPRNASSGYNFTVFFSALDRAVKLGYKPYIVTGNVPIALSKNPVLKAFSVNTSPPDNYKAYYNYLQGIVQALKSRYGISEMKNWKWGVYTEYNNPDWLVNDENVYFSIYDWTVCALEDTLGAENVYIGSHACEQCYEQNSGWDPTNFVQHVVKGTNFCTGKQGTHINFISNSFYETAPGNPGNLETFEKIMLPVQQKSKELGLNIAFGIDEGRILFDNYGAQLSSRSVGHNYQGSFDAFLFQKMLDIGVGWYSRWSLNAESFRHSSVDSVSTNVARLCFQLAGNYRLNVKKTGTTQDPRSIVDAVAAVNSDHLVQVLAYHHTPDMHSMHSETVTIEVCGFPANFHHVNLTTWIVDETQSTYWKQWWSDMIAQNITQFAPGWSKYSEDAVNLLLNPKDRTYFQQRVPYYRQLAQLVATSQTITLPQTHCVTLKPIMQHHSVHFYQFQNLN